MADNHPFRAAIEAKDLEALAATLAPDVVFHTPLRFEPLEGRAQAVAGLSLAASAFAFKEGFRYVAEHHSGDAVALFFQADFDGRFLEGVDYLKIDDQGLVSELRIMMRPLSTLQQFAQYVRDNGS